MSLAADHLTIGYPGHVVGRDMSLAVSAGEIVCLLGPNGSGKTTLFRTLLGLLPAKGGTARIDGSDIRALSRADIARRVAFVPQAHNAMFPYSILDMVTMGRTAHLGLFAQPTARDRKTALRALAALGIDDLAGADYTAVSGGQRQLALIARALAQNTAFVVMDEPTASLDFGNQALVLAQIRDLSRHQGKGVVLSTHDPDHALAIGDRVALLSDGGLIAVGPPADVLTAERLGAVYGVAVTVTRLDDGRTVCVPTLEEPSLRSPAALPTP
ncbi:ABC transporter ATP-binding protein [Microbaculum sp. FT89]|uniref:ABC transporter ATP-binding protein n=1 Tax=Microbaculum sp. FT89 TaxID=3447298 RepID=UPI003F53137E